MAFLKVFSQGEERTIFLGDDPILFGRGQDTDVLLKDLKASRHHCVIEPCGDGLWQVRDLESGNGTRLNGRKVDTQVLHPDDVVTIGDARILYAGEALAVVTAPKGPVAGIEPRPRRSRRKPYGAYVVMGAVLLVAFAVLLLVWNRGGEGGPRYGKAEQQAYRALQNASGDEDLVELAETYLQRYPGSDSADEVSRLAARARERLRTGTSGKAHGFDPSLQLEGLKTLQAIKRLEEMQKDAKAEHRQALRDMLGLYRARLSRERDSFFGDIERVFAGHVSEGEFARAREIWFFLRGDPDWVPIPPGYVSRIVQANGELETQAAAARTRLFEEVARAESAHDFAAAKALLTAALPRFKGTSVVRSLRERIDFVNSALREGVEGKPTAPPTVVRIDVEKRMQAAYAGLDRRDFAGTAAALRKLATEVQKERGFREVDARAKECEAAAALQAALAADLGAGRLPRKLVARKWRVTAGGKQGVTVKTGGRQVVYSWAEVPAELYLELALPQAERRPLGYCVLGYVVGGEAALTGALALALERETGNGAVHAFIASRVRKERLPEGGYVVYDGRVVSRKEYHRRREEALIKRFTDQFENAHAAILADNTLKRLSRLTARKDALDEARAYAKELIYDEKKYFYPYRGTGRMGEYTKVQQEVDRRVDAVRELWDRTAPRSIKASNELRRALRLFDEAAAQLERRLVYVDDKLEEVRFLRSYFGKKFTVRNFYRSPEERELLDYCVEVMKYNARVEGDITEVEREQVRITNEYRVMFGHQAVRLVEALVKSSRGHCEEMSKLGYFGHFSPTPGRRTPYDRMKLEGYKYGSSENCIMGQTNPRGAHNGWCHSSGHHRNLLMPAWTEMGTGHYGRYMTQNFGSAPKWREAQKTPTNGGTRGGGTQEEGEGGGDGDEFDYDDED